jgi:hypothetical protein
MAVINRKERAIVNLIDHWKDRIGVLIFFIWSYQRMKIQEANCQGRVPFG